MCLNPQIVRSPSGIGLSTVPCGHCLECLQAYQQDWTSRLSEEVKAWRNCVFFTLTYGPDSCPLQLTDSQGYFSYARTRDISNLRDSGLDLFLYNRSLREDSSSFREFRSAFLNTYQDIDNPPIMAVQTCLYDDVRAWLKYCRKWYDRHTDFLTYNGRKVSPDLWDFSYLDESGQLRSYPDCAYSKSFKYFITSEYGPTTLRPHYHGVMFGVTEEMFRTVFAPWWREHFGDCSKRSVKFSSFDPSKGGMLYISKYCSKGSFEHPLCSKVEMHKSGKSFNHRSFYKCVDYFGVDMPFCSPTFHLISKGIGVRYAFRPSVQRYWKCVCDDSDGFVCRGRKLLSINLDHYRQLCSRGTLSVHQLKDSFEGFINACELVAFGDKSHHIVGYDKVFVVDTNHGDDFLEFALNVSNLKYIRSYVKDSKEKTFSSRLPRYYRRFLLSPLARLANDVVSVSVHEFDFARKQEQIESCRFEDEKASLVREFERSESVVNGSRSKDFANRFMRFYSRQFAGDYED